MLCLTEREIQMMEKMKTMGIQQDTLPLILITTQLPVPITMNREGRKAPEIAETSFIDGDSLEKST